MAPTKTTTKPADNKDENKYFANAIIDEETGKYLEYRDLVNMEKYHDTWTTSFSNELRRLAQGIYEVPKTNTIFFISKSDIPKYRRKEITYGKIVVSYIPHKKRRTDPVWSSEETD